jgi:peroxiredoxin
MKLKRTLNIISFTVVSFLSFAQEEKSYSEIPEIQLTNIKGDSVELTEQIKGTQLTVISFWATWCAPCKKELNAIHEVYKKWQKEMDVQLIAVSIDNERTVARVASYIETSQWNYQVLLDIDWRLKKAFDINNIPFTVVVDENGNILYSHQNYAEGDEEFLYEELVKNTERK